MLGVPPTSHCSDQPRVCVSSSLTTLRVISIATSQLEARQLRPQICLITPDCSSGTVTGHVLRASVGLARLRHCPKRVRFTDGGTWSDVLSSTITTRRSWQLFIGSAQRRQNGFYYWRSFGTFLRCSHDTPLRGRARHLREIRRRRSSD